jgi:hypothetical protein
MFAARCIVVVGCSAALCGCGASGPVSVKGVVTVDGKPLSGAGISFIPVGGSGRPAFAATDDQGRYTLTTHSPNDGAMPGEYTVTIVWEEPPHEYMKYREGAPRKKELLKEYLAWKETHKPVPSPVPAIYADPSKTPLKQKVPAPNGIADFAINSK